ncbi:MAG: type II toxin-antitoxin system VapC family toxin [Rhodospirillales bacterium]
MRAFVAWLAEADEDRVFISVVTLAELRRGVERMEAGARRDRLDAWLTDQVVLRFEGRVLAIDAGTADLWGRVVARGEAAGRPVGVMDGFIAATAEQHDLAVVTRNVTDFDALGVCTVNPWGNE